MTEKKVMDLKNGDQVQGFFLLKQADGKTGSNGKRYLDLVVADAGGEINAKLWDCQKGEDEIYKAHSLVKIRGRVDEWQGRLQLRVDKIRMTTPEDGVSLEDFVPSAPFAGAVMLQELESIVSAMKQRDLRLIVAKMIEDVREKLLYYPAAKQNHHSIRSGLLYHILTMLKTAERIAEVYPLLNRELLFAGVILHDLAKIDEMEAGELGLVSAYTIEGEMLGHIIQGIKLVEHAAEKVGADKEVSMVLQHMILAHHYEPEFGSPKRPMLPEAEILHYLDLIDARMYDMGKVLAGTEPGQLSEKVWLLHNRRLYKTVFDKDESVKD